MWGEFDFSTAIATGADKETNEMWRWEYNEGRHHRALGEWTPNEFAGLADLVVPGHDSYFLNANAGPAERPAKS